ncbi:hypothetical protein K438DRAFT_1791136 [Mycena galopus ATCC 62051]|nr:hypothetical protein K438DRAFT_1791136 [Mycena galopus ATCC 62051]
MTPNFQAAEHLSRVASSSQRTPEQVTLYRGLRKTLFFDPSPSPSSSQTSSRVKPTLVAVFHSGAQPLVIANTSALSSDDIKAAILEYVDDEETETESEEEYLKEWGKQRCYAGYPSYIGRHLQRAFS